MKKIGFCLPVILMVLFVSAQDKSVEQMKKEANRDIKKDANDTIPKIWRKGGLFNLTFNQAALSNWSAGGDKSSISLSSQLYAFAFYKKDRNSWDNTLDLAFGLTSTTSLGTRKTDDRIDILSKYGYEMVKSWYLGLLFNARTQFAKGYNYPNSETKVLTSDFLAPAYLLLSPGINYKPNENFSAFLSPVTGRWVIVNNDSLASVGAFGVDSGKHVSSQFGAFASVSLIQKIGTNTIYTGRVDLFSNYLHNPQNISIYWTNLLVVKISKILAMSVTLNFIYDDNIKSVNSDGTSGGPKPQLQELLGIGFSIKF